MNDLACAALFCLRCLRHPGEEPLLFLGIVVFFLMGEKLRQGVLVYVPEVPGA